MGCGLRVFRLDRSACGEHQAPCDGKTESISFDSVISIEPMEFLEDPLQLIIRDSWADVDDI